MTSAGISFFAAVLSCALPGIAAEPSSAPISAPAANPAPVPAPATNPALPSLWFPVGEELHYSIHWTRILVGKASIFTTWIQEDNRQLLKIFYWTRSNRALSVIYPVNDFIVVKIDPATFRPVRFDIDLREGHFHRKESTIFDYEKKIATWTSAIKNKARTFPIESDTRDLVTFMYFLRSEGFKRGVERNARVMADDKTYDLNIKAPAEEKVELPRYGKVDCLRLEPTAQFEGIFVRSGKMSLWVSKDPRNICAKLVAEVPVGSIQVVLSKVGGPGQDFWITRLTNSPAAPPDE